MSKQKEYHEQNKESYMIHQKRILYIKKILDYYIEYDKKSKTSRKQKDKDDLWVWWHYL